MPSIASEVITRFSRKKTKKRCKGVPDRKHDLVVVLDDRRSVFGSVNRLDIPCNEIQSWNDSHNSWFRLDDCRWRIECRNCRKVFKYPLEMHRSGLCPDLNRV